MAATFQSGIRAKETSMLTLEGIRAMGLHLLDVLKVEKTVRFGRLCERLRAEEGPDSGAMQAASDKASMHLDLEEAAWQLKDLGVVRIKVLGESLVDTGVYRLAWPEISEEFLTRMQKSRPDFLIELTEKGELALAEGLNFRFRDSGSRIQTRPASEWLLGVLDARKGETLTLEDVMLSGQVDGAVVIRDDCGNDYCIGTDSYAWAFEVSLWHHARAANIVPVFKTPEQEMIWSEFVSRTERPSRPDFGVFNPLWEIPFRLSGAVNTGIVESDDVGTLER
jgi:hypothetical protein